LKVLGKHLLIEANKCNAKLIDDMDFIKSVMITAAKISGASIVGEKFHKFSPFGVTGILSIAESHITIHTWPEYYYAAIDIFTCSTLFEPNKAANFLIKSLESKNFDIQEIERGTRNDIIIEPNTNNIHHEQKI
tara:strand:+ start:772 stop:1173 length:402 start_codon:yes stop_codon:yes gene_type:complete